MVDWSDSYGDKENAVPASVNLQEAFRKFKKERQVLWHDCSSVILPRGRRVVLLLIGGDAGALSSASSPLPPAGGAAEEEGSCTEIRDAVRGQGKDGGTEEAISGESSQLLRSAVREAVPRTEL